MFGYKKWILISGLAYSLSALPVLAELKPLGDDELSDIHGQGIQIGIDVQINSDADGNPFVTEANALRGPDGQPLRDADGELIANRIIYSNTGNPNETGTLVFDNITGNIIFDDLTIDVENYTDSSGSATVVNIGLPTSIEYERFRLGDVKVISDAQPGGGSPLFSTEINGRFDLTGSVLIFGRD